MVQHKKNSLNTANGNTSKDLPKMSFQKRDMPESRPSGSNGGKGNSKPNGTSSNFRTDAAISASRPNRERVLQPWVAPSGSEGIDMTLEKSTGGRSWDQFAANERQFGIKTTYNENIYTTAIDKSHPQYKERLAKADKAAKEIENSATTTAHHAEERQMNFTGGDEAGDNEEDKYSGVKRQDLPALTNRETKYTPPARRAPAAASNVKGAPVDPAIISSQLRTPKTQATSKQEETKAQTAPIAEAAPVPSIQTPEPRSDAKPENLQKSAEVKPVNQVTPLKPLTATSRTISPLAKDAQNPVPNATATVERDVLKDFKNFAQQQRMTVDKARHTKAKADKEVKLIELKRFADTFKLPTPVPLDLIGIIAKDPAKQREIQEKANRDAIEVAKRKAEEAKEKEKKGSPKAAETQSNAPSAASVETRASRNTNAPTAAGPSAPMRNQGGRPPSYAPFSNNRSGAQHMAQAGRQGGLTHRIRESQKSQAQEMRIPPTGPANPSFPHRMGMPNHLGAKLNPNSHEFRPNAFAPSFSPNGHPSGGSSPRSSINHANGPPASTTAQVSVAITIAASKKGRKPSQKKCGILTYAKTIQPPETKNWGENGNLKPSYDTPPTWRLATEEEKSDSMVHLTYNEFFERQPFATQPTPNPPHILPQHMAHQHQLPLHMQHGAHNVGPRHSPHAPPVQMHGGQHNPVPHTPFNGADDHRMMHSNSNQSFSSPRMGNQVPMGYPATMHSTPQLPYGQHMVPSFLPAAPPMGNNFHRSLSNNTQFMPQQSGGMGAPMMMQPHFMAPAMGPPQMHMYAGGQPFIPPGATPQPMPAVANGYPSPGRPSAPMMVPGGSSQGQVMYAPSPSMQYQQPYMPQQGQMNNMRPSYNGGGPQQYGSSPQQMHQYAGPPHRNGNNNYSKNYQNHNQHHGPNTHPAPTGPQGRTSEGPDEAK